jgi:hypothetical protein
MRTWLVALVVGLPVHGQASLPASDRGTSQFRDDFDSVKTDPAGINGWCLATGDGTATMALRQESPGHASILVDATRDRRGIWWALAERTVAATMDLRPLRTPGHEVRIEARIRVSHAPRRVNLQVLTNHATDDYAHLMEFDIPDTTGWHTISMTTHGFHLGPRDTIIAHIALMDWGLDKYRVDLDYVKVEIVDIATAGPDQGSAVPYHPPIAAPDSFAQNVTVAHDSTIDLENTEVNLDDWSVQDGSKRVRLLAVDGTHDVILRWDLRPFAGRKVSGHGLLELTTHSVQRKAESIKDFGLIRVVEILGGDARWNQRTVTTQSLLHRQPLDRVLNPQMIIDWPVTEGDGRKTYLTISNPVLQRLIDGQTLGIAIKPLGAISATFHALEDAPNLAPRLRFNLRPQSAPSNPTNP